MSITGHQKSARSAQIGSTHRHTLLYVSLALCLLLIAACTNTDDTEYDPGTTSDEVALFATASTCSACHDGLTDADGNDISFVRTWSGSVHACASIDPYYLATVSHEVHLLPDSAADIEQTCATCHLPMANITAISAGASTSFLSDGASDPKHELHDFYSDAVSCMVCHQIMAEGLGTASANSGGFVIDTETTTGLRVLYGPFALRGALQKIMENSIGYTSVRSEHIIQSELCATCHTLYTQPVGADGTALDIAFPEQVPYLEWEQSTYTQTASCQSCHMPSTDTHVMISSLSQRALGSATLHSFSGGNVFLLNLVRLNADTNTAAALDASIQRTEELLQTATASITVEATRAGEVLRVSVAVENLSGHKLPTAFPSRRTWLHVTVTETDGTPVFESGAWNTNGSITGNDNDADAASYEPHYTVITSAEQVQIYESIIGNNSGNVTTGIIAATQYLKDNRLLPNGFDKTLADPDTAVAGVATGDPDFLGGGDTVLYEIPLNNTKGSVTVSVEFAYQSIGYRWLENLRDVGTPESASLFATADTINNEPVILASEQVTVD